MKSVDCVRSPEKSGGCLIFRSCGFVVPSEGEVEEGLGVAVAVAGIAEVGAATAEGGSVLVTGFMSSSEGSGVEGTGDSGFTSSSAGSGVEGTGDWVRDTWGESMGVAIREGMQLVGREAGLEDGLALATAAAGRTGGLFGSLWGGSGGLLMRFRMSCS